MIDTREIAAEYRLEHWAGVVRQRAESGLTVKAFCESEGLPENTYFYWQRKLRESVCERSAALPAPNGWAAVVSPAPGAPEVSRSLPIEIGKCRVIAGIDTDERLLAKVCRVLTTL
jgi:hypothetical protein